jgi:hypothetical protein
MRIHSFAAAMGLSQQVRRVWRGNPPRGKMSANAQVRRIFSLFDCLMSRARITRCFLLQPNVVI